MTTRSASDVVLDGMQSLLADLETFYEDLHRHPELSGQEHRTAGRARVCSGPSPLATPPPPRPTPGQVEHRWSIRRVRRPAGRRSRAAPCR